nr:unnamed protein product [Digitaria exilis]
MSLQLQGRRIRSDQIGAERSSRRSRATASSVRIVPGMDVDQPNPSLPAVTRLPVASGDHQQHQDPDDDDDLDAPFNSMQLGYQENAAEQAYHDVAGDGAGELGMELDPDVAFQDDDDDMWMQSPGVEATPDTRFTDDGGFGGVPASAAAIAGLKKKRYDGSSSGADDDDTCVICMREYKKGKKLFVMPCAFKHRFHRKCLKKWLARSHLCPLCRHALPTEDTSVHRSSI